MKMDHFIFLLLLKKTSNLYCSKKVVSTERAVNDFPQSAKTKS